MIKKKLLALPALRATNKMMELAASDSLKTVPYVSWGRTYTRSQRKYRTFLRCSFHSGILKVAVFLPDSMRLGARQPAYEIFLDPVEKDFLTYDHTVNKWRTSLINNLALPNDICYEQDAWMSHADRKKVNHLLHFSTGGFFGILSFQSEVRKAALIRRDQKKLEKWDQDMAPISHLPKDWEHWVDKVGIPQNFIFYRYQKGGAKTGYCSYCGKEVALSEKPRHNKPGRCPRCRHAVVYKSVGKMPDHFFTEDVCIYLPQKYPGGMVIREFWAYRAYHKGQHETPKIICTEHLRHLYDSSLHHRSYYWADFKHRGCRWLPGLPPRSFYSFSPGYAYYRKGDKPGRIYGKTFPCLQKDLLQRTGMPEWLHGCRMFGNPMDYLSAFRNYPVVERLAKAGLPALVSQLVRDTYYISQHIEDPDASSLAKALGIDAMRLKRLRRQNGGIPYLLWLKWEKQTGRLIYDDVIQWFVEQRIDAESLSFILDRMNPAPIRHYLERQSAESNEEISQVLTTWRDYLSMADRLGYDTSDEIVYRARKLRQRHDELVLLSAQRDCKLPAQEVLKKFPAVDEICQSIKEKYEYSDKKYTVIAPTGVADIMAEGRLLHHCVARNDTYWDRISRRETYLLFLRKTSAPQTPYYTLEIEPDGTVRQKRTFYDRQESDIKDATGFLKRWQRVVAGRLSTEDRKLARASRVLREQEFDQLRKDDVRLYVAGFNGQRMVDVLIADLVEAEAIGDAA